MSIITVTDLNNAQLDVNTIAGVATSTALTVTDRLGNTKNTLAGMNAAMLASAAAIQSSIGYLPPVAYATGISLTLAAQTVSYSAQTYAPLLSALPFTTSGTFETAKFRLIQGVAGADLSAPSGSSIVGFKQAGSSSANRTAQDKFRDTVSILDKGGIGDGVFDCLPALNAAIADGANRVRFPARIGAVNTYAFNFFGFASLAYGFEFDVDEGVLLSFADNAIIADTNSAGIKVTRPTRCYIRSLDDYYTLNPQFSGLWWGNGARRSMPAIESSEVDRSFPVTIPAAGLSPRVIAWPNSDVWNTDTFATSAGSSFSFTPAADSSFHIGMVPCKPGDEFIVSMSATLPSNLLAACVRHTNGYSGVFCNNDFSSPPQSFNKLIGVAGASSAINVLGTGLESYSGAGSIWTIRIDSWSSCTLLMNGLAVARFKVTGTIFECGFGGYPTSAGQTLSVADLVRIRGGDYRGAEMLSLAVFGDSKTATRYDAWPPYLKDALEFSCGIRCYKVVNYAVAGQSVSQQKAIMTGVTLSNYNVVVIDIGTNDVQGLTPLANFESDLTSMINSAQSAQCNVVLGVPSLWYTQTQAGAKGQASTNYGKGAPYRSKVIKLAAQFGCRLVDNTRFDGPVVANYVNATLSPNLTVSGDSVVVDNIHPTTETNKRRARAYAKVIASLYANRRGDLYLPLQQVGSVLNGWTAGSEGTKAQISADGVVSLYGFINVGTRTDGITILQLPDYLKPKANIRRKCVMQIAAETAWLSFDTSGAVSIIGIAGSTSTYIDISCLSGYCIEDREIL